MKKDKTCPFFGKKYTERSGSNYRHFDLMTGKVTWCRSRSVERRLEIQRLPETDGKDVPS
jgi:uncharacterized protein YprB with RNaseH-like and TPR domain